MPATSQSCGIPGNNLQTASRQLIPGEKHTRSRTQVSDLEEELNSQCGHFKGEI